MDTLNFLLICGVSGSGKNYIQNMLQNKGNEYLKNNYNNKNLDISFNKLQQVTTRKPRNMEEIENQVYSFITKELYDIIEYNLIAKTKVNENYYGTIKMAIKDYTRIYENKDYKNFIFINTVIVNRLGYDHFINDVKENYKDRKVNIFTLKIDCDYLDLQKRNGRNLEFIKKEDCDLEDIYDMKLENSISNRITVEKIIDSVIPKMLVKIFPEGENI